jgi:hypothetical protein
MCTVTLLTNPDGYTLMMNRDELRSRVEGELYRGLRNDVEASFPIDAAAGGTWIGVNHHGVSLALLNRYQAPINSNNNSVTRGKIIASALFTGGMNDVFSYLKNLDVDCFNPFDLLLVDRQSTYQFSWDRKNYSWVSHVASQPLMLTSSSERLDYVREYRHAQFLHCLDQGEDVKSLERFHLRQEVNCAADAVFMSRAKVHTKSIVKIRVNTEVGSLSYYDETMLTANQQLPSKAKADQNFMLKNNQQHESSDCA